jgi:hypothetical protein
MLCVAHKLWVAVPALRCGCARTQVCLRFNPVAEGAYRLPLFLRIRDGRQLQLLLAGRAVPRAAQLALAPAQGSHACQLAPAPVGELQPPLQQYTLRNGGPAPLHYRRARVCVVVSVARVVGHSLPGAAAVHNLQTNGVAVCARATQAGHRPAAAAGGAELRRRGHPVRRR